MPTKSSLQKWVLQTCAFSLMGSERPSTSSHYGHSYEYAMELQAHHEAHKVEWTACLKENGGTKSKSCQKVGVVVGFGMA